VGPIKKTSDDLKEFLFSSPVLSLLDLQQPFEIKTYSWDYVVGAVLTHHGHLMPYHSKTISDAIHK
jgi:hypothetical protein